MDDLDKELDTKLAVSTTLNDLPNDVTSFIISLCSQDMSLRPSIRLVNKRLMSDSDSLATRLSNLDEDGPDSLPIRFSARCAHVEHITCYSMFIRSLEGCPDGLRSLIINDGEVLGSLEPLTSCPLLEVLMIKEARRIDDISPLRACRNMRVLSLSYSPTAEISVVSSMPDLEELSIPNCLNVQTLSALSDLKKVRKLDIRLIDASTSLLPLSSVASLREIICDYDAVDLRELKRHRKDLSIIRF